MRTRSQSKQIEYDVIIDFDEASRRWHANKKKIGDGSYEYVCGKELCNGLFCKRKPKDSQYCYQHKYTVLKSI
jgi:hypothetical protein